MIIFKKVIGFFNSTPSVFLRPTSIKFVDVFFSRMNLIFWTFICYGTPLLKRWYGVGNCPDGKILCDLNNVDDTLAKNGIAVIANFLPATEYKEVINQISIDNLKNKAAKKYGDNVRAYYAPIPSSIAKYFEGFLKKTFISLWGVDYPGEIEASIQHLELSAYKCDLNDSNTIMHIDRFVPAVKIFYFPFAVDFESAPFGYVLGSHNIDKNYLHATWNSFSLLYNRDNRPFEFLTYGAAKELRLIAQPNTLVIAAVHGLHRRQPFFGISDHDRSRTTIRFLFYSKITKTLLLKSFIKSLLTGASGGFSKERNLND